MPAFALVMAEDTAFVMLFQAVVALLFSVFQVPSMPDLILFHPVVAPLLMLLSLKGVD